MATWAQAFDQGARIPAQLLGAQQLRGRQPPADTSTRALLRAVSGKIWLAETGGIVSRYGVKNPGFPQNAAHAAIVDHFC